MLRRASHCSHARSIIPTVPGTTFDPTAIALGFLFGGITFVAFRNGRQMQQVPPVVLGMALMVYPFLLGKTRGTVRRARSCVGFAGADRPARG